jgi:micrococcal nuclease
VRQIASIDGLEQESQMAIKRRNTRTIGNRGVKGLAALMVLAIALAGVTLYASDPTEGYELRGKVVRVADGDTITVRVGADNHRIRLASIDAPETASGSNRPGQPYAQASRRFLADLVAGKQVRLDCFEVDRYGRDICNVDIGQDQSANQMLVAAGMAWAYRQGNDRFLRDTTLIDLEQQARAQKLGLWADPDPIKPWVWRIECWRGGKCER